jgi:tyrosine decarboxylase/aspartate 1-decarboxylase
MFEKETLKILEKALTRLEEGFDTLPELEQSYNLEKIESVMMKVAEGMRDNYPYFHPYYAGQMLKPPHPVARVAYMLSM